MAFKDLVGRGDRSDTNRVETTPVVAVPAHRTVAPSTSIDSTTQLTGKIRCQETLRIDGRVKGEVRCDKTVIVGQAAVIVATIEAESVIVSGEIQGDLVATRKITLESTARVTGDLSTPGIVIEEGATLEGRIVINKKEAPAEKRQATSRSDSAAREAAPAAAQKSSTPPA